MAELDFRVLGPVELRVGGELRQLGGRRQRSLAAALVLHANELLSADKLIGCLWGEDPPASARHVLHTYVSQLRTALDGAVALSTREPGYVLEIDDECVDAGRFESRLRAARAAVPLDGLPLLDAALSEWRGQVAADVELEGDALARARQLNGLRLDAIELRNDAALAAGQHLELVQELDRVVAAEPLRERLRAQLMLALYRSGRQSEALAAYRDARSFFASELGIEPGSELRTLERRILAHDPSLELPVAASSEPPSPQPGRSRRRLGMIVALTAAAVAVTATVALMEAGGSERSLTPGSTNVIDGSSGRVVANDFGHAAGPVAIGPRNVWVAEANPSRVIELDRATRRVLHVVRTSGPTYAIAAIGDTAFAAPGYSGTIAAIGSQSFRPTPTSRGRLALGSDGDGLWIASQDGRLVRLDPTNHRVTDQFTVGTSNAVAVADGGVWVAAAAEDAVIHVDLRTGRVVHIPVGGIPTAIVAGTGSVWAATPATGNLWRIDASRNAVIQSLSPIAAPTTLAVAANHVWVGSRNDPSLVELDAKGHVVRRVDLPSPASHLAGDHRYLWVTLLAKGT